VCQLFFEGRAPYATHHSNGTEELHRVKDEKGWIGIIGIVLLGILMYSCADCRQPNAEIGCYDP
jgi:hypothetical protein